MGRGRGAVYRRACGRPTEQLDRSTYQMAERQRAAAPLYEAQVPRSAADRRAANRPRFYKLRKGQLNRHTRYRTSHYHTKHRHSAGAGPDCGRVARSPTTRPLHTFPSPVPETTLIRSSAVQHASAYDDSIAVGLPYVGHDVEGAGSGRTHSHPLSRHRHCELTLERWRHLGRARRFHRAIRGPLDALVLVDVVP